MVKQLTDKGMKEKLYMVGESEGTAAAEASFSEAMTTADK